MPASSSRNTVVDSGSPETPSSPVRAVTRFRFHSGKLDKQSDQLSIEEPLEIVLVDNEQNAFSVAITMRTPGHDEELAAGFLFAEGIIRQPGDIISIRHDTEAANAANTIKIILRGKAKTDINRLHKHFFTNSACGVCGKTSMQALELLHQPALQTHLPRVSAGLLCQLPDILRDHQQQFASTGGVHSAALFSHTGQLIALREDVGRHNALDKLIGSLLLSNALRTDNTLLLVSGRASFELVQKALMADIAFLAAIGAPTSLAAQLATRHGMTLAGFIKKDGFNIYANPDRICEYDAKP